MAYSIEARSPFQSEELIGVGLRSMKHSKFRKFKKEILTNEFPELLKLPILQRKAGFISPLGFWLRNNKDLIFDSIDYARKFLDYNTTELKSLAIAPSQKDYQKINILWSLIVLVRWHASQFK
jgi:hypothetical protein